MQFKELWEKLKAKLKQKYRLIFYNHESYEPTATMVFNRIQLFVFGGLGIVAIFILVSLILIFTPLKAYLPAYTSSKLQQEIIRNAIRVDSLENELLMQEEYLANIRSIISGKTPVQKVSVADTSVRMNDIVFTKSKHDSLLRKQIEEEEKFNVSSIEPKQNKGFSSLHFFLPVKGMITSRYNAAEKHYAVDLAAAPNEPILSVLDGTVTVSDWTINTGYVIQVQHSNNLVSMYKHCSALLKRVGDKVKAGEPIAIIGNSGELSTGPHLHFELWHNGIPLNPENYIVF
ncbi:MAG TPA: hypothetical protein DCQ31_01640 [Bacteroidales bacterium]|nr:hypothetical protein [Bacteroidales bacterium]